LIIFEGLIVVLAEGFFIVLFTRLLFLGGYLRGFAERDFFGGGRDVVFGGELGHGEFAAADGEVVEVAGGGRGDGLLEESAFPQIVRGVFVHHLNNIFKLYDGNVRCCIHLALQGLKCGRSCYWGVWHVNTYL
jgi:hypothetical protein